MSVQSANAASRVARRERAVVRADLRAGRRDVIDVLDDPAVAAVLLVDLVRWQRWYGPDRARELNARAVRDRVNLCMPASMAGERTRGWLALHARPGTWGRKAA